MALRIGLVVEGPTDYEIIERLLGEVLVARGVPAEGLSFVRLQPDLDATSGGFLAGGWTHVKLWCDRYPPTHRQDRFLRPIFAGQPARCDLIVVHLDADVIALIAAKEGLSIPPKMNAAIQGALVHQVLECWLWPDANRPALELHAVLPAVQATETWIVAGHDPILASPEDEDPVTLLLAVNPGLADRKKSPPGLKKSPEKWRQLYRRHLEGKATDVVGRCPHLAAGIDAVLEARKFAAGTRTP